MLSGKTGVEDLPQFLADVQEQVRSMKGKLENLPSFPKGKRKSGS